MQERVILLSAGGTGGHVFPAKALALLLKRRGYCVHIATDSRGARFLGDYEKSQLHVIRSATLKAKNIRAIIATGWALFYGLCQSLRLLWRLKPQVVGGFGGYPTFPPLIAALICRIPTFIQEQNAVMGRANKALAPYVRVIARGFKGVEKDFLEKTFVFGNPVREDVLKAATLPYPSLEAKEKFHLLVFGGSQGSHFFSECVPQAVALLPLEQRKRLHIIQQADAKAENLAQHYKVLGVTAQIEKFFPDLPLHMARAHYVIARSGASTVSEIAVIGRPSLLVPYPYALDHDQARNAELLATKEGIQVIEQSALTGQKLAQLLENIMDNHGELARQAHRIKEGYTDATERLADLVESLLKPALPLKNKENAYEDTP